jgi:hypothetical protein
MHSKTNQSTQKKKVAKARSPLERSLVGPAGEYYVLYRLHQQGLLASLAPRGAPTVDILVLSRTKR